MSAHVLSNLVVALLAIGALALGLGIGRSRLWRRALGTLVKRRPIALGIVFFYILIALLDSVAWVGGIHMPGRGGEGEDLVSLQDAQSVIDRFFPLDFQEDGYSHPFSSQHFYTDKALAYPGRHILGTDINGRDVFHLSLSGARIALLVGGLTSLIVIPIALFFGISAGYFGGRVDDAVFYILSTLASIPNILLLIVLVQALGKGTVQVCVALGITSWVGFCRLARGESMKLRELDYVRSAKALGASEMRIIFRHILPNLMHLVLITFVLLFSGLVLSEATLSFLGIGIDESWGQMVDLARLELARDPVVYWNFFGAFAALFGMILPVNILGDTLRDILDPRTLSEDA